MESRNRARNQEVKTKMQYINMRNLLVLALGSFLLLLTHCKVNYGFKGITIPPDAKSISVSVFQDNATLTNPIEPQLLSQRLRDAISSQTNLALLKQGGDLRFEDCRITAYAVSAQGVAAADQTALNRLTISIKVSFINTKDETKNFTDKEFTRFYDYQASQTLTQVEPAALKEINDQLVQDIFNAAFNNW